jgi:hypothetical protein
VSEERVKMRRYSNFTPLPYKETDLSLYQISILKEVKDQILHQTLVENYTPEETRAYLDAIGILDEKIEEINHAND